MGNKDMVINILGTGCPNCIKLEENTKKAIEELNIKGIIDKITDIETIMGYGIMSTPALVVDNNVICSGRVPNIEEIKTMLVEQKQKDNKGVSGGCGCGDNC